MSEFVSQAKQAREILARALGALQSDPTVPPALMDVAEPVAMAMGALHAIERSSQLGTASSARDNVRRALGMLQTQAALNHPAVNGAMESVASSLGIIFGLVKASESAPAQPAAQPAPAQPAAPAAPVFQPAPAQPAYQVAPAQPAYQPAPAQPAYQPPAQAAPAYQPPAQAAPVYQPAPAQPAPAQPAPAPVQPAPAPVQPAAARPAALNDPFAAAPAAAAPAPPPARPSSMASTRFEVALGINSPTNFYKGLSGNDVIEHGGIFVATYNKVPPVGTGIALRIMLPGGFEFESTGVVVWIRDSNSGESPGFGARFVQINADAKQLVYRYVRNREPLFYDDL